MNEVIKFLPNYNEILDSSRNHAFFTIDVSLQQDAILKLDELIKDIQGRKKLAAKAEIEERANAFLSLECAATSLSNFIEMFILLKKDDSGKAWDRLIAAQGLANNAMKANFVSATLGKYSDHLIAIEKVIFPPQKFLSSGMISEYNECSLCKSSYEECTHIAGKVYMGEFCQIIAKNTTITEVSLVKYPEDKRCRVTHLDDKEGYRNRMTWKIESSDNT